MVGVGTYNMAGAKLWSIIGPKLLVVVMLTTIPHFVKLMFGMMIG
jgi:hypothetical protein